MARPRSCIFALLLLAASCGSPTSRGTPISTPESEGAVDEPEGTDPTAAGAPVAGVESPGTEARPVEVEALGHAEASDAPVLEEGTAGRLVSFRGTGVHAYAGRGVAKIRRAMRRASGGRRSRASSMSALGSMDDALGGMDSAESAAPAREAPPSARPPGEPEAEGGDESVTNTQVAGVDEGGIVKAWRDFLVILRRGRLFTARLGDRPGAAAPVSAISVRPPGSAHDGWYDEMLIHAPTGTVVVVGFSYEHEATEIGLFRIAADGTLSHHETHLLRSNDYYSSRNYASRLVGDTLIFYMPHYLMSWVEGANEEADEVLRVSLPSTRAFHGGRNAWRQIVSSSEVYRMAGVNNDMNLHTVVTCDLASRRFACRARGIIGGEGRTFYVSRDAIYVWVMPGWSELDDYDEELAFERLGDDAEIEEPPSRPSYLFRLPLDGARPSALVVRGAPVDQFSFHEASGNLWVLVRAEGGGDAMWEPELTAGAIGLLRVPLSAFDGGVRVLSSAAYRTLPSPPPDSRGAAFQNRFVGDYLLYGTGTSWGRASPDPTLQGHVFVHRYGDGQSYGLGLSHGVDRIEAMADDAVLVGTDGADLHFRAIELGEAPRGAGTYVRRGAAQGETRSHGFFYKPIADGEGVLGLPTRSPQQPGVAQLRQGSAEVLFLSVRQLDFAPLGALAASGAQENDRCEVSCVDWYGNARPLFYRGRVFALLGYELVEGRTDDGVLREVARTSFLSALGPEAPVAD